MLQTLRLVSVVLGFIIVLGAAYLFFHKTAEAPAGEQEAGEQANDVLPLPASAPPLVVTHTISKGVHTVNGTIALPNPCYFLDVQAQISESDPSVVTLVFTASDEGGICVQVIDERSFEVEFEAPDEIELKAVKDGAYIPISEEE